MIIHRYEMEIIKEECAEKGIGLLKIINLLELFEKKENVGGITFAELLPGSSVGYHIHDGENEMYYILSGSGIYNDNGINNSIGEGDFTITKSKEGHGIENTGKTVMTFMTFLVLD